MMGTWRRLTGLERTAAGLSVLTLAFLIVDPLALQAVRSFDEETRALFRSFTDLGKSNWILIPLGAAILVLAVLHRREGRFRTRGAYAWLTQVSAFLFAAVALPSLAGSLAKNIIGRARPKVFDETGPLAFEPLTFDYTYASFPSGHAVTICALAAALAILWPRARTYLFIAAMWVAATRFLIGSHYLTDAVGGAALGFVAPYLMRDRLAAQRWLFESRDGAIALRSARLQGWLGASIGARLPRRSDIMAQSG